MEFLKNHKKITSEETKKIQLFLIENFKRLKEEGRSKEYAIDTCSSSIYKNFIKANFIGKYSSHFERVYTLFQNAFDKYDRNDQNIDVITQILKNEIFEEFQHFGSINKISNREYDDDFDSITFEDFVVHLLKYHVANEAKNNLNRNSELYYIFYDTNDYSDFTLESFEDHIINTEIYRKLFKNHYPKLPLKKAVKYIDDWNSPNYRIEDDLEIIDKKNKKIYLESLEEFDTDEQALLINLCIVDKNSIPLTEKTKLLILLGEIKDKRLLSEDSSINNFYKKVNEGYQRKGSVSNTIDLIESIIIKIEPYQLNITKQRLKKQKSILDSEKKQAENTKKNQNNSC